MEMVWKACAIGVLCATVTLLLRPAKGEFATLARIGGGVLILLGVKILLEGLGVL